MSYLQQGDEKDFRVELELFFKVMLVEIFHCIRTVHFFLHNTQWFLKNFYFIINDRQEQFILKGFFCKKEWNEKWKQNVATVALNNVM